MTFEEFVNRWSVWWILNTNRQKLDEAFKKELNELIERELALRMHDVVEQSEQLLCPECLSNRILEYKDKYQCRLCWHTWEKKLK